LDEKCKKLEEKIQRVAINTIGYKRKQANKEWFDEECVMVNEEKNAAREPSKSKPEEPRMLTNKPAQKRGLCSEKRHGSSKKRL
jgi:hypothetical protein